MRAGPALTVRRGSQPDAPRPAHPVRPVRPAHRVRQARQSHRARQARQLRQRRPVGQACPVRQARKYHRVRQAFPVRPVRSPSGVLVSVPPPHFPRVAPSSLPVRDQDLRRRPAAQPLSRNLPDLGDIGVRGAYGEALVSGMSASGQAMAPRRVTRERMGRPRTRAVRTSSPDPLRRRGSDGLRRKEPEHT
nr:hypothetical protein StreXyl84_56870 [Streptomyces sp. Xyl84]